MALIKCPECGKEISEKAKSCPNCGCPINDQPTQVTELDGEFLCCPKCSSKELHAEKEGFSGGKALTGAILVGQLGLLAGTLGSREVKLTCLKCGYHFKAGEAKIVKTGSSAKELDMRIIKLLCDNKTVEAEQLYKSETHCDSTEAADHITYLIDKEVPKYITPEQKEAIQKYYQQFQNGSKNSGCMGVMAFFIVLGATIFLLI